MHNESVLHVIAKYPIFVHIHLLVQSQQNFEGNESFAFAWRIHTLDKIKTIIPESSISQDMIAGFPTETEEDHQDNIYR
jgi:tRNA-2-methylthio-N6-dimethylallyladenosine synthase